jgi:GAF domain-containing protein
MERMLDLGPDAMATNSRSANCRPSESFNRITRLATELFKVPFAVIALVDVDRLWLKACVGLDIRQAPRHSAFSDYVIRQTEVMVIEDATQDLRFSQNPLVTGEPGVRFFAGAPLLLATGQALGSLASVIVWCGRPT